MKKNYPLVSIIIVNWNGGGMFDDCLKSLESLDYPRWELILVDNGSKDNSQYLVKNHNLKCQRYELIQNTTNLGFAEPNNQGYRISKGKYILLLNNDTKVKIDFLSVMIDRMEKDPRVGVSQPKIYLMEKAGYLDNTGSYITKTGLLKHEGFLEKDAPKFNKEKEIFAAKGACMLIKREIIEKAGLFDKDFFAYFEESDFCWKSWILGYSTIYYPKTFIFHKLGATSKKMNQIAINYHSLKNRISALIKNLGFKNLFVILPTHIFILIFIGILYLIRFEFNKSKMVFSAICWNITHLPKLLSERKKIQKLRVFSDDEIFRRVGKSWPIGEMLTHFKRVEANY